MGRLLRCLNRGVESRLSNSQRSFPPLRVTGLPSCPRLDNPPSRSRSAPAHRCRHRCRFSGFLHSSPRIGPKSREEREFATGQTRSGRCNLCQFAIHRFEGGVSHLRKLRFLLVTTVLARLKVATRTRKCDELQVTQILHAEVGSGLKSAILGCPHSYYTEDIRSARPNRQLSRAFRA